MKTLPRVAAVGSFLALVSVASPARAANFTVNPMQLSLTPKVRSAVVTLKNTSTEELRFQISAFTWDQDDRGGIKLADTNSLIVFPQLLTLAPGAQRQVRVGTDARAADTELCFRLFFEELPAAKALSNGVQMRTRIGLPVFVSPAGALTAAVQIQNVRAADGKLTMDVRNTGKAHIVVDALKIVGADASGKAVYTREVPGWYVLPNRSTTYDVDVKGPGCTATAFTATVVASGKTVTDRWSGSIPGCQ
jgi:fimbrial chaperone protein